MDIWLLGNSRLAQSVSASAEAVVAQESRVAQYALRARGYL